MGFALFTLVKIQTMEDASPIGVNKDGVNFLNTQHENHESRDRIPSSQLVVSPNSSRPLNRVSKPDGDGFDPQQDDDDHPFEDPAPPGTRRWHRHETLSLLTVRSQMDAAFRVAIFKAPLWEEVSRKLADLGIDRSAKKCKEKFENLTKYYKRSKQGASEKQNRKTYRFFKQLDALYLDGRGSSMNNATGCADEGSSRTFENTAEAAAQKTPVASNLNGLSFSSGSLDDYDDDSGNKNNDTSERSSRKRKRNSEEKMTRFFEKFMEKVSRTQEMMHQKYFEIIEKLEQERIAREEAWKRQELARLNAEAQQRSRDRALSAARDSALISFLHKFTGQTLTFPQPQPQPQESPQIHHNNQSESALMDPGSRKRWPMQEVEALIKVRNGFETKFHNAERKARLWDQISAEMSAMGFNRSPKRCKEKWENINKYFRKAKDNTKEHHEKATTCPYFQLLDDFYNNAIVNSPSEKPDANIQKSHMDAVIPNDDDSHHNQKYFVETGDNSQPDSTKEEICQNNNVAEKEEKPPDADQASSAARSSFMAMLNK